MIDYKEKENMVLEAMERYKSLCAARTETIKAIKYYNPDLEPILNIELLLARQITAISDM